MNNHLAQTIEHKKETVT